MAEKAHMTEKLHVLQVVYILTWHFIGARTTDVGRIFVNYKDARKAALGLVEDLGMDCLECSKDYWRGPDGEFVRLLIRGISGFEQ